MFTPFTSFDEMVKVLGKETVMKKVNQKLENEAYRKDYNSTKNEIMKAAKSDPRFADIVKQVRSAKVKKTA